MQSTLDNEVVMDVNIFSHIYAIKEGGKLIKCRLVVLFLRPHLNRPMASMYVQMTGARNFTKMSPVNLKSALSMLIS